MTKKDKLFLEWKDDEVHTHVWFESHKISNQVLYKYLNDGLIAKLGGGAYIKGNDKLDWQAAVATAQTELNLPIHIGGSSAFALHGTSHNLSIGQKPILHIFNRKKIRIPIWIKKNNWGVEFSIKMSTLFKDNFGLEIFERSRFKMQISSRERAVMEIINSLDLSESFETLDQYFEVLSNIRGELTQKLLEECTSVKVKRIFLYMANKYDLAVVKKLNTARIDLGTGKRSIFKNGKLDKKFNITIPPDESDET